MVFLLALVACSEGPFDAPSDAKVASTVESLTVTYNASIAPTEDGYGLLFHNQAHVTQADRFGRTVGLENIAVDIYSYWSGAYILPQKAVKTVDDFATACAEGAGDEEYQELCDVFLSEDGNQYFEITGEYELANDSGDDPGFRPNYLRGVTDNTGTVDYYIFLDSTPGAGTDFGIEMSISADYTSLIVSTASAEGA